MGRTEYILKRTGLALVSMWVVATIVFLMFRLIPGDPTAVVADPGMSAEARQRLVERFGLEEPLYVQYYHYMTNLVQGDLGMSYHRGDTVLSLLIPAMINTLALMLTAVILAYLIGPFIGAILAWNRNTTLDTVGIGSILIFYAAPVFWVGMLGIMVFSFQLQILPSGGLSSGGAPSGVRERFLSRDFLWHLALPLTVTTLYYLTTPALIMRNNMIDVLNEDFIQMAKAEGIAERAIMYKHAARNALLPVLHYWALSVGFAFGGSVVIETVFSWPGVGRLMWQAVLNFDYPLAQGAFLMIAFMIITMNLLADLLSVYLDPRIKEGHQ